MTKFKTIDSSAPAERDNMKVYLILFTFIIGKLFLSTWKETGIKYVQREKENSLFETNIQQYLWQGVRTLRMLCGKKKLIYVRQRTSGFNSKRFDCASILAVYPTVVGLNDLCLTIWQNSGSSECPSFLIH